MQAVYRSIDRGLNCLLDGGKPYSFDGVLWRPPAMSSHVAKVYYNFGLGHCSLQNRSGASIVCGFGGRFDPGWWRAGYWSALGAYTDKTTEMQQATTNDMDMETTTNSDGFVVQCRSPFNALSILVGTASTGGTPIRTIYYTKTGGLWGTIPNALVPPVTSGHWATGENVIAWSIPTDWSGADGHGTGLIDGLYTIAIVSDTAPSSAGAKANSLSVAMITQAIESLVDNDVYEANVNRDEFILEGGYDSAVALISSVAAIQSRATMEVRVI